MQREQYNQSITNRKSIHWAEITAERLIRQNDNKKTYVLASGITPSGVVHFGNFREVITVDLVARALRTMGKEVRFIFSWDDYDTFRKIPKNMPQQEILKKYLFQPIVDTPDPYQKDQSYAEHHEKSFENQLKQVGIKVESIYQAQQYRAGKYKEQIKFVLDHTEEIKRILDQHRTTDLPVDWLPISIYCQQCNTDNKILNMKRNDNLISYDCDNCDSKNLSLNLENTSKVKLPWRIDWPMRWAYESVDFEPGGKDHSSQGGSFTTSKEIVKIFNADAPLYLQYDFVSIKGAGGKMSSSSGEVITLNQVLEIYEPEMIRYIFASYKTNVDFSISFDLDVIKTYEDFDKMERLACGVDTGNAKKVLMAQRVYELSQIKAIHPVVKIEMPFQPSFRHLTNILQINNLDINKSQSFYAHQIKTDRDQRRFSQRANCALNWLKLYAPNDFKFSIMDVSQAKEIKHSLNLSQTQINFFKKLKKHITEDFDTLKSDKELHEIIYQIINELSLEPKDVFFPLYKILINREKGPKLAGFIRNIGKSKTLELLSIF